MRLLTLEVRDFRGIASRRVELLPTGVTILEGPNEAGKTSLAEAVEMLFERHDSSSHVDVREAQPVGRDVGPEVEVEAEAGDYRFRYRKRFLRRPETVLEVLAPRPESHTGREAHDRVLALLEEAGVDRDLWKALRVVQGAGSRQPDDLSSSASLLDALGAAATAQAEGSGRHPVDLHQRIREEAERYWTAKRGDPTGELRDARGALAAARQEEESLAGQMAALEQDAARSAELERRRVELSAARERAAEEERAAAAALERVERLEARVRDLRGRLGEEQETVELLRELEAAQRRAAELEDRLAAARAAVEAAAAAFDPARQARETAAARSEAAEARLEALRRRVRLVERLAERRAALADLSQRAERVKAAAGRRAAAEARLAELPPVEDDALAALDRLHREIQRLEAGLQAAAPHLEITALTDLELRVEEAGGKGGPEAQPGDREDGDRGAGEESAGGPLSLAAGESWRRRPAGRLVVELPGVAAVTVAPGGDAEALARDLEKARAALAQRCNDLGVEDLEAARAAHRDRRAARGEVESSRAVLASLLGPGETPEALEDRRRRLEDEVGRLEQELAEAAGGGAPADGAAGSAAAGADSGDAAEPGAAAGRPGQVGATEASHRSGPSGPGAAAAATPAAAEEAVRRAAGQLSAARDGLRQAERDFEARRRAVETAKGTLLELEVERRNAEERRRRAGERAEALLRRRSDDASEAPPAAGLAASVPGAPPAADPGQLALFAAAGAARGEAAPSAPAGSASRPDAAPAPPSLADALAAAEARAAGLGDELAEARRRLAAAEPERVRRNAEAARAARERAGLELRQVEDEHLQVSTRLDAAGERGLFEALEEARGRRAAAARAAAAVEARAAAARRLLRAVDDARETARRAYSEPLARTLEELGRPLFGEDFAVELDESLNVARRTAFGLTLELPRLSAGAQEQLALLTRLACAVLVSPSEGVPLIVDDALGHSDEDRLAALGEVLSRVGERCQVLILTCFPERYRHVRGARRVRLPATGAASPTASPVETSGGNVDQGG